MSNKKTCYQAKKCFVHRKVADNDVLISVGENIANFNGYVALSYTASFLWDELQQPRSVEQLVDALMGEFDVSTQIAIEDVETFLKRLLEQSMIEVVENE